MRPIEADKFSVLLQNSSIPLVFLFLLVSETSEPLELSQPRNLVYL